MTNSLLADWDGPFGLPRFDAIRDDDVLPAFETARAAHLTEIEAIADDPEPATFDNTVLALEAAGSVLDRVLSVFFTLAAADSTPARQEIQRALAPRLADHGSAIHGNRALFARIRTLWDRRADLGLGDEEARLLDLTHRGFLRAGAALEEAEAARMRAIRARLSELGTAFAQNLLADEAGWRLTLSDEALAALPAGLAAAARAAAAEHGADGAVITLSRSLVVPFLQEAPDRALREVAWRAWTGRGASGGATDNRAIAAEVLALRAERAALLGYDSFADYKLETEMAATPGRVRALLNRVWAPARAQAEAEARALAARMARDGVNGPLQPWDWRYYAEARRRETQALDDAELKPYLQLDRMIAAAMDCARRLFGLEFREIDAPLYHPDCRAWEVTRGGAHRAVFVADYFARTGKRSGAWCSALRMQARRPAEKTPVAVNVCNFARPAAGAAALLSWDDARTLFHEFGHALHHILSDVAFGSLAGTSVARDFVELPSQLFEHWLDVPEVLDRFATHVETGEPMPPEMRDRVLAAGRVDQGFQTVEYIASALVDLEFHAGPPPADPMARQAEILTEIGMPEAIAMRHATPHFAHVFAGDGYSSGYYSYMWSEVMDADAFAAFAETGDPFDPETARRLEAEVLSRGGSAEAEALYRGFRGRMPGVEALLEGRGLDG